MGAKPSLLVDVAAERREIETYWSGFLESCCVIDEAEFTPLHVLESAFAAYMRDIPRLHDNLVKSAFWLDTLCASTPGITFSPGWVSEDTAKRVDTRLVMGVKIARIRPKAVV